MRRDRWNPLFAHHRSATGLAITRRIAATVVAPWAMLSDALATACCNAGDDMAARKMALTAGATGVFVAT